MADPRAMKPTVEQLLSRDYAAKRRALIGSTALEPKPGTPYCGDTVYLNAVSYTHLDVYKRQPPYSGRNALSLPLILP